MKYTEEQTESLIRIREFSKSTQIVWEIITALKKANADESLINTVGAIYNRELTKMMEAQDEFEANGGLDKAFEALG